MVYGKPIEQLLGKKPVEVEQTTMVTANVTAPDAKKIKAAAKKAKAGANKKVEKL